MEKQPCYTAESLPIHEVPNRGWECDICGFQSAFKTSLINHQAVHSDARPFECPICDYAAKRKYDLKKHVHLKHNKDEPVMTYSRSDNGVESYGGGQGGIQTLGYHGYDELLSPTTSVDHVQDNISQQTELSPFSTAASICHQTSTAKLGECFDNVDPSNRTVDHVQDQKDVSSQHGALFRKCVSENSVDQNIDSKMCKPERRNYERLGTNAESSLSPRSHHGHRPYNLDHSEIQAKVGDNNRNDNSRIDNLLRVKIEPQEELDEQETSESHKENNSSNRKLIPHSTVSGGSGNFSSDLHKSSYSSDSATKQNSFGRTHDLQDTMKRCQEKGLSDMQQSDFSEVHSEKFYRRTQENPERHSIHPSVLGYSMYNSTTQHHNVNTDFLKKRPFRDLEHSTEIHTRPSSFEKSLSRSRENQKSQPNDNILNIPYNSREYANLSPHSRERQTFPLPSSSEADTTRQKRIRRSSSRSMEDRSSSLSFQTPPPEVSCSVVRREVQTQTRTTFACSHCGIIYVDHALYLMHMGLHSADNPWKCAVCGETFWEKYSFTSHFINLHSQVT